MPNPSPFLPRQRLLCLAVLALLGACANPVVKLDVAGHSLQASPGLSGEPTSMSQAIAKLNHVRATYYEAIRDQTAATQNSVTGLVWLGAVMLGAGSHVHRDVQVTAGVVGGTTYGLSVAQIDKRRIDVWQAGIDALDCARAAIVPLEMEDGERLLLADLLRMLRNRKMAVTAAQYRLAAWQGKPGITAESELAIADLLASAAEALKQATRTQEAGEAQLRASRGSELSASVNRISSRVTQVMGNLSLPVSAVKDILVGLPAQINAIVPGALPKPPASPATDGTPKAEAEDPAARDSAALKQAVSELIEEQRQVNAVIEKADAPAAIAALKTCNVAEVIKPFELVPATVTFVQGRAESRGFEIKGGLSSYSVKVLGVLPEGVSHVFEGGDASVVSVSASDKAKPSEARLLVSDRSNPAQTQQFVIKVVAAPTSPSTPSPAPASTPTPKPTPPSKPPVKSPATTPPPSAPTPSTPLPIPSAADAAAVEAAWRELQAALVKPGFSRVLRGVTLSVESTEFKSGRLIVKLRCSKADAALPAIEVREELASTAPQALATLRSGKAVNAKLEQIDLSRNKPCVKE